MYKMKIFILILFFLFVIFASPAFAQGAVSCPPNVLPILCGANIGIVISTMIDFIFVLAALTALGFLLFGVVIASSGSGGDAKTAERARNNIVGSIIGLIIILL